MQNSKPQTLRPYQLDGVERLLRLNRDCILADEPGIGKTAQALEYANRLFAGRPATLLIVCPAHLRLNWWREIRVWLNPVGVTVHVVSYEGLTKAEAYYDLVVFDEAHYLKNPKAQRTRRAFAVTAGRRLFLTGTPVLNRPMDLYPLLAAIGMKTTRTEFGKRYCAGKLVLVRYRPKKYAWDFTGASNLAELNAVLRKYVMVRRTKADVLPQLPPKSRTVIEIEAPSGETSALRDAALRYFRSLTAAANAVDAIPQFLFTEMARARQAVFEKKRPHLLKLVADLLEEEEKVIIGAHHRDAVEALEADLAAYGPVKVYGGLTDGQKQRAVEAFQRGPARVFIGQIQAAGTGLDLSAAATVVIAEPDWVPGNMIQFEDRPHRVTQRRAVRVFYLVMADSIEARMVRALVDKQQIIERTMK